MFTLTIYASKNAAKQTLKFDTEGDARKALQEAKEKLAYSGSAHLFNGAELIASMLPY